MMLEATLSKLQRLKLPGMARGLEEQTRQTIYGDLSFEERLGLLVDREMTERDNRKLANLLKGAKLRYSSACPEDIDFRTPRGLAKDAVLSLCGNGWITARHHHRPHWQWQNLSGMRPGCQRLPGGSEHLLPEAPKAAPGVEHRQGRRHLWETVVTHCKIRRAHH